MDVIRYLDPGKKEQNIVVRLAVTPIKVCYLTLYIPSKTNVYETFLAFVR